MANLRAKSWVIHFLRLFLLGVLLMEPCYADNLPFRCKILERGLIVEKNGEMNDREDCLCIPLVEGIETDQLLSITLPGGNDLSCKDLSTNGVYVSISQASVVKNRLIIPPGAVISREEVPTRRLEESKTHGTKSILMVRVSTPDAEPEVSADLFYQRVFGEGGFSIADQYDRCSFGQLQFESATENVLEITLEDNITDYESNLDLVIAVQDQLRDLYAVNRISGLANHVMMCLPPGVEGDWVAFAGINDFRSAFKDNHCGTLSITMHEIGHNLGLKHSNERGDYLDTTGYMGVGRDVQNFPLKCFNAEKNWHLGWYSDHALRIDPVLEGPYMIKLSAFVDYDSTPNEQYVLINVGDRFFVQYNRAKGMNSETEEKRNKVTIAKHVEESGSEMVAGLDPNRLPMHVEFYSSDSALVFHVCEHLTENDVMLISIGINESLCQVSDESPFFEEMMDNVGKWSTVVHKRESRLPKGSSKLRPQGQQSTRKRIRG